MSDNKIYEFDVDDPLEEGVDLFEDDTWEAPDFVESVSRKFPGWHLVKIIGFNSDKLDQIDAWCRANAVHGDYSRVGWNTGCSYSVGVVFEKSRDAMMFTLRWR